MKIKILISYAIPAIILFLFFLGLNSGNRYSTENLVGKLGITRNVLMSGPAFKCLVRRRHHNVNDKNL